MGEEIQKEEVLVRRGRDHYRKDEREVSHIRQEETKRNTARHLGIATPVLSSWEPLRGYYYYYGYVTQETAEYSSWYSPGCRPRYLSGIIIFYLKFFISTFYKNFVKNQNFIKNLKNQNFEKNFKNKKIYFFVKKKSKKKHNFCYD